MIGTVWGRQGLSLAAFLLCVSSAQAGTLCATRLADDAVLGCLTIREGARWTIVWNHSVEGFEVKDVYENRQGHMVLVRSHQPDFAAGLGHIPGRGQQVSDGQGGYWIEGIDEPVPGDTYVLRPGLLRVNHRIRTDTAEFSLSAAAPRTPVRLTLTQD